MFCNRQSKQHFKLPEEPRTGSGLPAEERGASRSALPAALGAAPGLPGAEGKLLLRGAECCRKGRPGIGSRGGQTDPRDRGCRATAPAAEPVTHHRLIAGSGKPLK